jgi:hypothetical protein
MLDEDCASFRLCSACMVCACCVVQCGANSYGAVLCRVSFAAEASASEIVEDAKAVVNDYETNAMQATTIVSKLGGEAGRNFSRDLHRMIKRSLDVDIEMYRFPLGCKGAGKGT